MMYWILTREVIPTAMPPQGGDAPLSSTRDIDEVPRPTPPHEVNAMVPGGLSDLVMQCVEKNREDRPESMLAVLHRLDSLSRGMISGDS